VIPYRLWRYAFLELQTTVRRGGWEGVQESGKSEDLPVATTSIELSGEKPG